VRLKIDVERIVDSIRATLSPRDQRIGQVGQVRRVITAGHAWCPRQDSNLRSRLRRPVDVVIAEVFRRPTWAFCSLFCVFGDLPCAVVRSTSHPTTNVLLGQLEGGLVLGEVSVASMLTSRGARGRSSSRDPLRLPAAFMPRAAPTARLRRRPFAVYGSAWLGERLRVRAAGAAAGAGAGAGATSRCAYCAAVRGRMFLLIRKKFSGSQRAFTAARRSKFGPNAACTRSSPSSALRKLR
jgi:hypothetical protein